MKLCSMEPTVLSYFHRRLLQEVIPGVPVSIGCSRSKIGTFDLLFFGRMAIDGDTAQVGPEVAGQLGIPQVTQLIRIEGITPSSIWLAKRAGNVRQQMEIAFPCAVMVSKETEKWLLPTLAGWREAQKK